MLLPQFLMTFFPGARMDHKLPPNPSTTFSENTRLPSESRSKAEVLISSWMSVEFTRRIRSRIFLEEAGLRTAGLGIVFWAVWFLITAGSLVEAQNPQGQGSFAGSGSRGLNPGMSPANSPGSISTHSDTAGAIFPWSHFGAVGRNPYETAGGGYQGFLTPTGVYRVPPEAYPALTTRGPGQVVLSAEAGTQFHGTMPAQEPRALTLSEASWTYRPPTPPRTVKLHDIIVVLVDEKTQVISEGELDRRKTAKAAWTLKDWVLLKGLKLIPDPQSRGDPKISGEVEQSLRAEGEFSSRGAMKFRIACEVVDIRPNGTLVLEGRRWLRNNEEIWEISLLGVVRPEDVLPNNTVLSENVANLRVFKREIGHVRDGYRRGWFTRLLDEYQPF